MDGVRGALVLLSTLVVVSNVTLDDPGRLGRVVWYPSLIPGLPRIPRYHQELPRQTLQVPATIHLQWLKNGSHFRFGIVPESSQSVRCSHSSPGGMPPHPSREEQRPHHSQGGQRHYFSQDVQHPRRSKDGQNPHYAQGVAHHDSSQQEHRPHSSQDEHRPHYSQAEQHPHHSQGGQHHYSSREEPRPYHLQDEQYPYYSQDGLNPHYSQDSLNPHYSQEDQHPNYSKDGQYSSQDDEHPHSSVNDQNLLTLFSDEYDLTIEPPSLRGYDQLTTVLSVFADDSSHLLPVQHHDLSQLSSDAKEQLKSVGTLEEALKVPGLSLLLQEDEEERAISTLDDLGTHRSSRMHRRRGGGRGRVRRPATSAPVGLCEVERVSVRLEAPPGSRLIPSCVRVGKCGGCCAPGRTCVTTRINTLSVKVLQLPDNLRESRSVRRYVEEAAECRCQCQVRANDCDVATQDYDPDTCECVCKSSLAEDRARCEASPKHQWDLLHCACICVDVRSRECSSGQSYSEDSCSCETTREE